MAQELYIATNNGDMGGGEVMLLNIARAARSLGYRVTVIGPAHPPQLVEAAADEGFARVVLPARTRSQYDAASRLALRPQESTAVVQWAGACCRYRRA